MPSRRSLLLLTLLALAACHKPATGPVEVVLGDQAGLTHAKIEAAGALKDAKYPFRWANFQGAAPLFEAMNAGAIDTGIAADAPLVQAVAGGVPLKVIAVAHSSGRATGILVPKGSPIQGIADLAGKRVIVSTARGSISHFTLLGALDEAHVPAAKVTIGFMLPHDAAAAFDSGQIEAWAIFGSYQATAESRGARLLRDGQGINSGVGVIVASAAALADPGKRAAIADYLRRQARASRWSREHPDAYAAVYAKQTGVPLAVARTLATWENPDLRPATPQDVADLQKAADRLQGWGVIPKRVDIAPVVELGFFTPDR